MNKAKLKTYAPLARKDFIAAVMARANLLGISEKDGKLEIAPSEKKGDVTLIAGHAWPAKVQEQREHLIKRIQKTGFGETAEAIAYTWFNRFAALRFMEIHDYLGHGHRVLSSREGGLPEIIAHATELVGTLPGLNAQQVADMKLAGNQDGELYRLLLVAQCNALSSAMPFLFERIDDESELLLPGNLERTDSVVVKLVEAIPEEDWNEVEVIGWLYQFYISEKKDEVIGKVVKSEDIPAATQLFTPSWIVKYLVQNSVGRLWLMANPTSTLKSQWSYYIEPAEQTPEVQAQLDALIQIRMSEDGGSLNPETITVLDPACGSGHILVEAYEVLKGIYLERGYQARAIPRLILEKNLYGLDIDDRAAQLAGFALLMKARADDRRLLDSPIKLNVLSLQESAGMDLDEFAGHLKPHGIDRTVLSALLDTFTHAKTFGSLIQIQKVLEDGLDELEEGIAKAIECWDVFARAAAQDLVPLVQQTKTLAMKFDAVVANPPYMGRKNMDNPVKSWVQNHYPKSWNDLYGCFIERASRFGRNHSVISMVTMQGWMFISSFEDLRKSILECNSFLSMLHIGYNSFPSLNSKIAQAAAFSVSNQQLGQYVGTFIDLNSAPQSSDKDEIFRKNDPNNRYEVSSKSMSRIPGTPIAYWADGQLINCFSSMPLLRETAIPRPGLSTTDNGRFLRYWHEISINSLGRGLRSREEAVLSRRKWFPFNKGGDFRKWYGNNQIVVNWKNDGEEIRDAAEGSGGGRIVSSDFYFQESLSMSSITTGINTCRYYPAGSLPDANLLSIFSLHKTERTKLLGFLNSNTVAEYLAFLSPTIKLNACDLDRLPYSKNLQFSDASIDKLIDYAKTDWDDFEQSWDFKISPLFKLFPESGLSLKSAYLNWCGSIKEIISEVRRLESENNSYFNTAYGIDGRFPSAISIEHITLTANPAYRYGGKVNENEQWIRHRQDSVQELISYAIGGMMGRYSLDEPGLIYAHAGNVGFDATRYKTFPADADGIIPITDELWFEDDAANRIREFILAVWPAPTFDENMAWLAESLGTKGNETPDETIRRYLASSFFKDHLQTYKKRPIYWLFSSGKQCAFQALVYLHRYHEGTLARMRAEYVVPLTGKMQSRIEMLEKDKDAASPTAARNKIAKQIESLKKKHVELLAYDEKLRHYADMRISIDLDDGVKVNYGKFGDLLADVKAVTGGANDE